MILHPDAIAKNRAATVWTGGINRYDTHRAILLAVVFGELINQGTLARPGSSGQSYNPRLPTVRKKRLKQFRRAGFAVLDRADSTRQGPRIAPAQPLNPLLQFVFQTVQPRRPRRPANHVGPDVLVWASGLNL